jgi:hypothetical protein
MMSFSSSSAAESAARALRLYTPKRWPLSLRRRFGWDTGREGRWIDAAILDRIDITAQGRRHILLITRYGTRCETGLDRYLSRVMAQSFAIQGASEDVDRLVNPPAERRSPARLPRTRAGRPPC